MGANLLLTNLQRYTRTAAPWTPLCSPGKEGGKSVLAMIAPRPPNIKWYNVVLDQYTVTKEMARRHRAAMLSCKRTVEPLMRTSRGRMRFARMKTDLMNAMQWGDAQLFVLNRALHVLLPQILGSDAIYDMEDVMAENKWNGIVNHLLTVAARGTGKTMMIIWIIAAIMKCSPSHTLYFVTLSKDRAKSHILSIGEALGEMIARDPSCKPTVFKIMSESIVFACEDRCVQLRISGSFGYQRRVAFLRLFVAILYPHTGYVRGAATKQQPICVYAESAVCRGNLVVPTDMTAAATPIAASSTAPLDQDDPSMRPATIENVISILVDTVAKAKKGVASPSQETLQEMIPDEDARTTTLQKLHTVRDETDSKIQLVIQTFGKFIAEALEVMEATRMDISSIRVLPIVSKKKPRAKAVAAKPKGAKATPRAPKKSNAGVTKVRKTPPGKPLTKGQLAKATKQ